MRLTIPVIALATLISSCQHWPVSSTDPTPPMAPVAAETFRKDVSSSPAPAEPTQLEPVNIPVAPLDSVQPAPPHDLWERIRQGFELGHHLDNSRVQAELNWYRRHPAYLDRVAARAERHLYHIVETIERRDMPLELALLPIVESAFDPFAYSHGRAAGLWQFIPGTARRFGLQIDWWYDGRRDVPAATDAALDYLQHLHDALDDDWLLALAAYNAGEGNVFKAIRRNKRAGKPLDFWSLGLPRETSAYAPRLLAISALIADPESYGVELKSIANEPRWEAVDIGSQLDLARAARLADLSTEELYLFNPAFNQWSTDPGGPHRLLIPVENAARFKAALAELPADQRVAWQRHKIRQGENLGLIATRYHTSIEAIKTANDLNGDVIRAGDSLLIPVAARDPDAYALSEAGRLERTRARHAEKYDMEPTRYTVKRGDSLWEISRRFGVSTRKLAKWNGMAPTDVLRPDTELVLFVAEAPQVAAAPQQSAVIRKVNYRVRSGESLSLIASKFNLSVGRIREWNSDLAGRKYIHPGDRLTLYIDVTALQ